MDPRVEADPARWAPMSQERPERRGLGRLRRALGLLGPGIITGAADDDPSGIATYSQTGAQFGYGQLWTILLMLPMMVAVQQMCAAIGLVTGKGLAGVIRARYPRPVLYLVVGLLVVANTINLGADLGAMAAATRLLLPLPTAALTLGFALLSLLLEIGVSYQAYARFLKWLCLALGAYVLTGIIVSPHWGDVLYATFVPQIQVSFPFLMVIVAVLGTTISPYMFFWQASEEVEEEIAHGQLAPPTPRVQRRPRIGLTDLRHMRVDTWAGMISSQVASWFIILTAAGSLHVAGKTTITTAADAAAALQPLVRTFPHSGEIAQGLFALGIIGLGLLAIPVFAGSLSYALAETFGWQEGLSLRLREAPQFYGVMTVATLAGLGINFVGLSPMTALVYAAVVNGVVAVPLILVILLVSTDRGIMGAYVNRRWVTMVGWCTLAGMGLAALFMFLTWRP